MRPSGGGPFQQLEMLSAYQYTLEPGEKKSWPVAL